MIFRFKIGLLKIRYQQGNIPVRLTNKVNQKIEWLIDEQHIKLLDIHYYIPMLIEGLQEKDQKLQQISFYMLKDLFNIFSEQQISEVVPQIIMPIKSCLRTKDHQIIQLTLDILECIVIERPLICRTFIPYFSYLLVQFQTIMRIQPDFEQPITDLLDQLVKYGGKEVYLNIKYYIPTYSPSMCLRK